MLGKRPESTDRGFRHQELIPSLLAILLLQSCGGGGGGSRSGPPTSPRPPPVVDTSIASLASISYQALREQAYSSALEPAERIQNSCDPAGAASPAGREYDSFTVSYPSDGLALYSRMDVPVAQAPSTGYPVLIFAHGYIGLPDAPSYGFSCGGGSGYAAYLDAMAEAGFVVLVPGFRGHGTVGGRVAEEREFMAAWDNGSYLSTSFYAIDVLNLIAGLPSIQTLDLGSSDGTATRRVAIDTSRVYLAGHSQGGDVVLTVLAAAGEGAGSGISVAGASIWAGTFPDRFTQLQTYHPMETTREAFVSGDGRWTGTAVSASGAVNPNFVFGYPPDWIETPEPSQWTWQSATWNVATVMEAVRTQLEQMYATANTQVDDIGDASFQIAVLPGGSFRVIHDPQVESKLSDVGGYGASQWPYLTEPLNLHFSDRDFYSWPEWNEAVCHNTIGINVHCNAFLYPRNTHSLGVSDRTWFSDPGDVPGHEYMIARDLALFSGGDPAVVPYP